MTHRIPFLAVLAQFKMHVFLQLIGPSALWRDAMALESVLGQALSRNKVRLKQDVLLETGDVFQGKFQVVKPAGNQM